MGSTQVSVLVINCNKHDSLFLDLYVYQKCFVIYMVPWRIPSQEIDKYTHCWKNKINKVLNRLGWIMRYYLIKSICFHVLINWLLYTYILVRSMEKIYSVIGELLWSFASWKMMIWQQSISWKYADHFFLLKVW